MKIRKDFVTNSSSSSFIIGYSDNLSEKIKKEYTDFLNETDYDTYEAEEAELEDIPFRFKSDKINKKWKEFEKEKNGVFFSKVIYNNDFARINKMHRIFDNDEDENVIFIYGDD